MTNFKVWSLNLDIFWPRVLAHATNSFVVVNILCTICSNFRIIFHLLFCSSLDMFMYEFYYWQVFFSLVYFNKAIFTIGSKLGLEQTKGADFVDWNFSLKTKKWDTNFTLQTSLIHLMSFLRHFRQTKIFRHPIYICQTNSFRCCNCLISLLPFFYGYGIKFIAYAKYGNMVILPFGIP